MSEAAMIKTFVNQITCMKTVKKVFMNKRDIKIYDRSWNNISEFHTEYDIEIITSMIGPPEWRRIVELEKEFDRLFPEYTFYYHLIESDPTITNRKSVNNAKLVYDSETSIDPGQIKKVI